MTGTARHASLSRVMQVPFPLALCAFAVLAATFSPVRAGAPSVAPLPLFPHPERIRYDGHCLQIEGRDFFLSSASFHYCRTPPELWCDRFQKIKDAGLNTVETYVPWNWHERDLPPGLDDFSKVDLSELEAWLKMAQDEFRIYSGAFSPDDVAATQSLGPDQPVTPPLAPSGLNVSAGDTGIQLPRTEEAPGTTSYTIQRSASSEGTSRSSPRRFRR
jgi:hypothetical protein